VPVLFSSFALAGLLSACQQDMADQPKIRPFRASAFFEDGRSARPQVAGTLARDQLRLDTHMYQGTVDGAVAERLPFPVTRAVLERGHERYTIFCSPCHDRLGSGQGMVVQRGFPPPPSFHIPRLRAAPVGYFFSVITEGFGRMYAYADRINPHDRWAIIAYLRALQLSQYAALEDVPAAERQQLQGAAR
jgi:hypothetical protein